MCLPGEPTIRRWVFSENCVSLPFSALHHHVILYGVLFAISICHHWNFFPTSFQRNHYHQNHHPLIYRGPKSQVHQSLYAISHATTLRCRFIADNSWFIVWMKGAIYIIWGRFFSYYTNINRWSTKRSALLVMFSSGQCLKDVKELGGLLGLTFTKGLSETMEKSPRL